MCTDVAQIQLASIKGIFDILSVFPNLMRPASPQQEDVLAVTQSSAAEVLQDAQASAPSLSTLLQPLIVFLDCESWKPSSRKKIRAKKEEDSNSSPEVVILNLYNASSI